jgi:urease accessory protein
VVCSQAAERFYRAREVDLPSRVRTAVTVEAGADLDWLPQETILFDRFSLERRLEVDMAPDARFLGVETLVFGRLTMGESIRQGWLRDLIRIRRGEELLLHDAIRMDGDITALLDRPAVANGGRAVATLVYVAPEAEGAIERVRAAFGDYAEAGASAWKGMLLSRIVGPDSAAVRRVVISVLAALRVSRPLPRVWLC